MILRYASPKKMTTREELRSLQAAVRQSETNLQHLRAAESRLDASMLLSLGCHVPELRSERESLGCEIAAREGELRISYHALASFRAAHSADEITPPRRSSRRWKTVFGQFVLEFGANKLAATLGVTRGCIYHRIAGDSIPRPAKARHIVDLAARSGVELTLATIWGQEGRLARFRAKASTM